MFRLLCLSMIVFVPFFMGCSAEKGPEQESALAGPDGTQTSTGPPAESPVQVAEAMMQATQDADDEAFMKLLTKKARQSLETGETNGFNGQQFESYTIGESTIEGENASVAITAVEDGETQNLALKMRQEDNAWRVFGIAMVLGPESELLVNLENVGQVLEQMVEGFGNAIADGMQEAFGEWEAGGSEEEIAFKAFMYDALGAVPRQTFEQGWKNDEDFRGQPTIDAINSLTEPVGLRVHAGEHKATLAKEVATDVRGLSRLEAIERLANETGVYPVYPDLRAQGMGSTFMHALTDVFTGLIGDEDAVMSFTGPESEEVRAALNAVDDTPPPNALTFETGAPEWPVIFAGPFRVEVTEVEERPPNATGKISLTATAYGLHPGLLARLEDQNQAFQITAVEDAKGNSLIDEGTSYYGAGQIVGGVFHDTAGRDLKNLLRSVEAIERIKGTLTIDLPGEVSELEFNTLRPDVSMAAGPYRLTIEQVGTFTKFNVTGPEGPTEKLLAKVMPLKADGSPLGVTYSDFQSWRPGTAAISLNTPEEPAAVHIKLITKAETFEYPFELEPIPLKYFAEMPEKLLELSFEGHDAPVTIELVNIVEHDENFSKVNLRFINRSNKAPTSVFVEFIYRDAAGTELKKFPSTINGGFTSDGWQPVVLPGETTESEQTAFSMPANTKAMDFRFISVEFNDGTKWEAPK